jgi:hypothetical protein
MAKAKKGVLTIRCSHGGSGNNRADEEKEAQKKQQKEGFGDVPYEIYSYCSQNCSNYNTHTERIAIEKLKEYSTACGKTPNHPFTPPVTDFIKANSGKDFVIAEVYDLSQEVTEEFENQKVIINMAIHWNGPETTKIANTNKFSEMISDNGGSLRAEEHFDEGWDMYESE